VRTQQPSSPTISSSARYLQSSELTGPVLQYRSSTTRHSHVHTAAFTHHAVTLPVINPSSIVYLPIVQSLSLSVCGYFSSTWSGFCSAGDINKLDRFLNRCKSFNSYSQTTSHIVKLFPVADQSLFKTVSSNSHHVLHRLLPNNKISMYYLRSRAHNLTLTSDK